MNLQGHIITWRSLNIFLNVENKIVNSTGKLGNLVAVLVKLVIGDTFCIHPCVPLVMPFVSYSPEQLGY